MYNTIGDKLRLDIYKYVRTLITNRYDEENSSSKHGLEASICFCSAITKFCSKRMIPLFDIEQFPELMDYRPINKIGAKSFWFPVDKEGLKTRIDILNTIIEKLDAKISRSNNG